MRCDLEYGMHCLQKSRLIRCVSPLREIYHGEVDEVQLSSFVTNKELTNLGMRSIASNDHAGCLAATVSETHCRSVATHTDFLNNFTKLVRVNLPFTNV
jgi:hypothetical protein